MPVHFNSLMRKKQVAFFTNFMKTKIDIQKDHWKWASLRQPRWLLASLFSLLMIGSLAHYKYQTKPRLIIDASVKPDFAAVIKETWKEFMFVFGARSDCFGDVRVEADYVMTDRAMYDPKSATVTVRVPERRSILKGALVHEWAHHVEFQCEAHTEMRAAFMEAQGIPSNTPWRSENGTANILSSDWANIPSEQYAETTIVLVLGERPVATSAPITEDGVDVIRAWAYKENSSYPPASWIPAFIELIRPLVPGYID